ncbi:hypothetical protein [Streptomyces doebereineriae]|uniref:LexA repressor DNA-binding domain-containing protein n=1 Tax=Streptomyces doebereineriae TaxID=3075528 RepID=A0ABU2VIP3_9ACTN|nr:hypothetical protein [Streptomyces sp. DSM 41640]MDT0485451.1 hypothetical protein [Streptomyces sp. DSM 41640]
MTASVLAPDYQRIVAVLESEAGGREGTRCQQLAVALGLEAVPAKVEGLRSKAQRLVERGWVTQVRPGRSPLSQCRQAESTWAASGQTTRRSRSA